MTFAKEKKDTVLIDVSVTFYYLELCGLLYLVNIV